MEGIRIIELVNQRKKREKHFLNKDGTFTAFLYKDDVHLYNNKKYLEIDNHLEWKKGVFQNKRNQLKVSFQPNLKEKFLTVKNKSKQLKIGLKNSNTVIADKSLLELFKFNDKGYHYQDEINYYNVLEGVDLNYQLKANIIKESIILNHVDSIKNDFIFEIEANDLEVIENVDGSITFQKYKRTYFVIEAPYMFDQSNNYNYDVNYQIKKKNNKYELKLNLDKKWLKDKNRVYPVVVDPTITTTKESSIDTCIYEGDENDNTRHEAELFRIGVRAQKTYRSLLKFQLPEIATGDSIIHATLGMLAVPIDKGSMLGPVVVHEMNTDWDEKSVTWNDMHDKYKPRIETHFKPTTNYKQNNDSFEYTEVDLTNLVRRWYAGAKNHGIMLKYLEENETNYHHTDFFSKDYKMDDESKHPRPILMIHYRNQTGLETYMNYKEQTFSQGQVYTNDYNGNLTAIFKSLSTTSSKLPVSLQFIYNTNDIFLNPTEYGIGLRLNLYQTLEDVQIDQIKYLKYIDEDGTRHYFRFNEEEQTYQDEDNISLKIHQKENDYVMKDLEGNESYFQKTNNMWVLKEIKNLENQKIQIEYDGQRIIKIIDGNQETIQLRYLENQIIVENKFDTIYFNYENQRLISINYKNMVTKISYYNNLISKIEDVNQSFITYDYYDTNPFRIKTIKEYGLNKRLGKALTMEYGFNTTTFRDQNNKVQTVTFNDIGNIVSITNLESSEEVDQAFGKSYLFGEESNNKNRITLDQPLISSVNNLILNSSFEEGMPTYNINQANALLKQESPLSGINHLEVSSNDIGTVLNHLDVSKNKYYTFSAYIKRISSNGNLKLFLQYQDSKNKTIRIESPKHYFHDNYLRIDTTIYLEDTNHLTYGFQVENGTFYIDDIQLENSEVANYYNLIDNSDFQFNLHGWQNSAQVFDFQNRPTEISSNDEVITLSNYKSAYKLNAIPNQTKELSRVLPIKGKKGDTYNLSFWYKNNGIKTEDNLVSNAAMIRFDYVDVGDEGWGYNVQNELNPNSTEWQFYSNDMAAEKDYNAVRIYFHSSFNANELYLTNFSLFKDVSGTLYHYDESGQLKNVVEQSDKDSKLEYDSNHQLLNIESKGYGFSYEYDEYLKNRLLRGISKTGIVNELIYDEHGNVIETKTNYFKDIQNGNYHIRLKGTNLYLEWDKKTKTIIPTKNPCFKTKWNIHKTKDKYTIASNKHFLTIHNAQLKLTENAMNYFQLIENKNKSISIKIYNLLLTYEDNILSFQGKDENKQQEFYFEDSNQHLTISNYYVYDEEDKYLIKHINGFNHATEYIVNEKGITTKAIDQNNMVTDYSYNELDQITEIKKDNKKVVYEYNKHHTLAAILHGTKKYQFQYDDFFNNKSVSINDRKLITSSYEENNGKLKQSLYGNGHVIHYNYDDFERLKTIHKMNQEYNYFYNNKGFLTKIKTNDDEHNYEYDFANRLHKYRYQDFEHKQEFDCNNQINHITFHINNKKSEYHYQFNQENNIIEEQYNQKKLMNYQYDELARLTNETLHSNKELLDTSYQYLTKNNQTSSLIQRMNNRYLNLEYSYDKLNNIKTIKQDKKLILEYEYDSHNQLITEHDVVNQTTTKYNYDNVGNILSSTIYEYKMKNILNKDVYKYQNPKWEDQLTSFNQEHIKYDEIGNPIRIGTKQLSWINGRELSSYEDNNMKIEYFYNQEGIRTKKMINGLIHEYYLSGNKIIVEKCQDNMIEYIYNSSSSIIGFILNNNETYYYLKNLTNDIIAILDAKLRIVANYHYDGWGRILSITDADGNIIEDKKHISHLNPHRYRSYYYDTETNLYYLNSRYYNPEWRRFINADNILLQSSILHGNNLYQYCNCNPIKYEDSSGQLVDVSRYLYFTEIPQEKKYSLAEKKPAGYRIEMEINGQIYIAALEEDVILLNFNLNPTYSVSVSFSIASMLLEGYKEKYGRDFKDRTVEGIAFELNVHHVFNKILLGNKNLNTVNMGNFDNDNNAIIFESPKKILDLAEKKLTKHWRDETPSKSYNFTTKPKQRNVSTSWGKKSNVAGTFLNGILKLFSIL